MRRSINFPEIFWRGLYKLLGLIQGDFLGEELISLYKDADTLGLKNWVKKEYG